MATTATLETSVAAAQTFRLRTPLLSAGRSHTILASCTGATGAINIAIKCYTEGGENEFHTHAREDHTFIVLQGRARFFQPDRAPQELGRNEGILLPAGALYKFEVASDEPLVLLRAMSGSRSPAKPPRPTAAGRTSRAPPSTPPTRPTSVPRAFPSPARSMSSDSA
jgi:mannose-6-phosphate isomerase-like protein (cupin superfamily)